MALVGLSAVLAEAQPARGEIHDYMILRLLYLHSSCGVDTLVRISSDAGTVHFKAKCRNVSGYPDGVEVVCTDPDDDRHCTIATKEKSFDNLELLQKGSAPPP